MNKKIEREFLSISDLITKLNSYIGKRYWTVCGEDSDVIINGAKKNVDRLEFDYVEIIGFELSKLTIGATSSFDFHIKTKCLYSTLNGKECNGLCTTLSSIFGCDDIMEANGYRQDALDLEIDIELEKCDAYCKKDWRDFLKLNHKEIEMSFPETEKTTIPFNIISW